MIQNLSEQYAIQKKLLFQAVLVDLFLDDFF